MPGQLLSGCRFLDTVQKRGYLVHSLKTIEIAVARAFNRYELLWFFRAFKQFLTVGDGDGRIFNTVNDEQRRANLVDVVGPSEMGP